MKDLVVACIDGEALGGYVAATLWRSVQVARPRESTSGGRSKSVDVCEAL